MVPKLHKKGTSFKGAAAYLLHDKGRATSSDRVAWTDTHNLALSDPHAAWRIMAATAMDRHRRKDGAGIKRTGTKSEETVLHLSLGWRRDEAVGLSQDDMKAAASGAIRALGAEDYQALIIAHNDTANPHLHILINRAHPQDGRLLPSSMEKAKLSKWAMNYEKQRGKIYCEERLINHKARERGEYTRAKKDVPRHIYEDRREKLKAVNDNKDWLDQFIRQQARMDASLAKEQRSLGETHSTQRQALDEGFKHDLANTNLAVKKDHQRLIDQLRDTFKPAWRDMHRRHDLERARFEKQEKRLLGRLQSGMEAIGYSLRDDSASLGGMFSLTVSRAARKAALEKRQAREENMLLKAQRAKEKAVRETLQKFLRQQTAKHRERYLTDRENLLDHHAHQSKAMKEKWYDRKSAREHAWHEMQRKNALKENARQEFDKAVIGKSRDDIKQRIKERLNADRERDKGRDDR